MPRTNPSSKTASPAASSLPELPFPAGLCAIHQLNYLPRLAKLFAADHWIVVDDVQFVRRDYQHRARIATFDGLGLSRWLTIPTHRPSGRATLIRDSLIADPGAARRRASSILRQQYGSSPHWPALDRALQPVWDGGSCMPVASDVVGAVARPTTERTGHPAPVQGFDQLGRVTPLTWGEKEGHRATTDLACQVNLAGHAAPGPSEALAGAVVPRRRTLFGTRRTFLRAPAAR